MSDTDLELDREACDVKEHTHAAVCATVLMHQ